MIYDEVSGVPRLLIAISAIFPRLVFNHDFCRSAQLKFLAKVTRGLPKKVSQFGPAVWSAIANISILIYICAKSFII